MIPTIIAVILLLYAVGLLFLLPMRDVSQPPGRRQPAWEVLFPGTSPAWHVFGGLVLIAWTYFVLQILLIFFIGTCYLLTGDATPSTLAYGVPGTNTALDLFRLINPSWVWVYLAPAVLFAVNLFVVLRSRGRAA
ncbi:MAG TPA: hypothetical protein VG028_17380 [Terriglobia bacterium]|nr:hypothetical protein [Terriglobia bacterium]